jgi:nucleotide-binding universal stress UspA family protein
MILFSVWDIGWDTPIQDKERVRDLADRGRAYLKTYLNGVAKEVEQEGIRCDTSVSSGHAAVEILAAIYGSSADLVAMATHGRRATTEGQVEVFRAVPKLLEEYGHALPEGYLPPIDEARRDEALRYMKDVQNRHPGIAAGHVGVGAPRHEIPAFLDKSRFDLVVMMSRSIHGRGKWALGGVADQVIEGPTPVILVPPPSD